MQTHRFRHERGDEAFEVEVTASDDANIDGLVLAEAVVVLMDAVDGKLGADEPFVPEVLEQGANAVHPDHEPEER